MPHELTYVSFGRDESVVPNVPDTSIVAEESTDVVEEVVATVAPDGTDAAPAIPVDESTAEVPVTPDVSAATPAATE